MVFEYAKDEREYMTGFFCIQIDLTMAAFVLPNQW